MILVYIVAGFVVGAVLGAGITTWVYERGESRAYNRGWGEGRRRRDAQERER
jgi:hypothetical protein